MIIRHFANTKQSPLTSLAQPPTGDMLEQPPEVSSYLARILQPEHPIQNSLVPPPPQGQELPLSPTLKTRKIKKPALVEEKPHLFNTAETIQHSEVQAENVFMPFSKQRMTTFARPPTPPHLSRNPLCIPTLSNNPYLSRQPAIQQQEVVQRHPYLQDHKSTLYRTIQKHKFQQEVKEHHSTLDVPLTPHHKYTFSLPKHSSPLSHTEQPLKMPNPPHCYQPNSNRLGSKRPRGLSQPTLLARHKMPPNDPQQAGLLLPSHRTKQITHRSFRKTSEEESRVYHKEQTHFEGKGGSHRSVSVGLDQRIQVSYRTPLRRLKQICSMKNLNSEKLQLRVPEVFAYPLFNESDTEEDLFKKGKELLSGLGVTAAKKDLSIRRYSNCVVLVCDQLGIVWHYTGRVYLGGWKQSSMGGGCKQGLGLEWSPNKYFYYGQFNCNKRQGVGLMKSSNSDILAGHWRQSKLMAGCREEDSPIAWLKD